MTIKTPSKQVCSLLIILQTEILIAKETDYQNIWCSLNKGEIEVTLNDRTRVDCLTASHAIEFDFAHKWAEEIGQSLYYSLKTGKKAGIVLIYRKSKDHKYLVRLKSVIDANDLPITIWTMDNKFN